MSHNDGTSRRGSVFAVSEAETNDDFVDVIVPLTARHASTLRTITATFGVDTGFSIDEIDDFKLALSEAFSMLVASHADNRVRARFAVASAALSVRLSLESGGKIAVQPDELALAILREVVDSYEVGKTAITLQKRATEALTFSG